MSNLSDKDLDRLSREAADSYEPDTSSLSWSRLEQKLTEQMPGRPPDGMRLGRINPYIWGPAAILVAGLSFFLIKNSSYSEHSTLNTSPTAQKTNLNKIPSATEKRSDSSSISDAQVSESNSITDSISKHSIKSKEYPDPAQDINGESIKTETEISSAGGTKNNRNNKIQSRSQNLISGAAAVALPGIGSDNNSESLGSEHGSAGELNTTPVRQSPSSFAYPGIVSHGTSVGQVHGNDSLLNRLAQSKKPTLQKSLRINRSLNFGFAFGPDYSNAGGIANNQISNNIGITIGYYLTNKLSLNTGIFYSNKYYWSPGKSNHSQRSYNPNSSYNSARFAALPPVDYVNGACNMYELPLTLRYDVAKMEKVKFFVNAGVSSYFMMKQTYIYFFHSGANPLAWKESNNQQVNYWFSVADFSAGFESDMGKGFSFQAEPFLRLPFTDMGVQNIKINSFGLMLSFRYAPVLSRSKK